MRCNHQRQGDEWYCGKCKLRWGTNENVPDCPIEELSDNDTDKRDNGRRGQRHIRQT